MEKDNVTIIKWEEKFPVGTFINIHMKDGKTVLQGKYKGFGAVGVSGIDRVIWIEDKKRKHKPVLLDCIYYFEEV